MCQTDIQFLAARFRREYIIIMSALIQYSLFDTSVFVAKIKESPKRNRFNAWENFYTVYMYDFTAYHTFCTDLRKRVENFPNDPITKSLLIFLKLEPIGDNQIKAIKILSFYALLIYLYSREDEPIFREYFFILDEEGKRIPLGDEKHIYRIATLHRIKEQIYNYCNINPFESFETKQLEGLIIWGKDKQAEIPNTWDLSIKDRAVLHIKLLRLLRKGFSIKEALNDIQKR